MLANSKLREWPWKRWGLAGLFFDRLALLSLAKVKQREGQRECPHVAAREINTFV